MFPGLPDQAYEELIVQGRTLFGPVALISDPAGVRRVLVENAANYPKSGMDQRFFTAIFGGGLLGLGGEAWRRHRRVMAPAFDPRSVAAYGPAIAAAAMETLERWDGLPPDASLDMAEEMTALTLQVISRTVFSTDSADVVDLVSGALREGLQIAAAANVLDLVPMVQTLRMRARERRMARASKDLDAAIHALAAAKDEDGSGGLSAKEIRDEVVTIFMAGHETTANALSWIWYLLAERPAEAAILHHELDQVLAGRAPRTEDLGDLVQTRAVVEEALRLYPAAPGLSIRRAVADDEVCGRPIAKGSAVSIMPWVLHRHRRLWSDPERFDPARFLGDAAKARPRFAYLPFGAGPRVCIGQILALNELVLILAALAQSYAPVLGPDAKVEPMPNITLQMRYGLKMRLRRRRPRRGAEASFWGQPQDGASTAPSRAGFSS
jgi:cytochrome P450